MAQMKGTGWKAQMKGLSEPTNPNGQGNIAVSRLIVSRLNVSPSPDKTKKSTYK